MAGGTATASFTGLAKAAVFLSMASFASGQETCTSVTVSGGDSPGVYERPTGSSYFVKSDDSAHVLQPLSFGGTASRRNLQDGGGGDGSGRRGLANDCTSQIWILADTTTLEEEGFPYYTAFDCATHPASVESTWLLVECDECSEVAEVTVVCTAAVSTDDVLSSGDSGDGVFTLPVIIGIVAGGLVFLLCIGLCFCHHRRRAHKGSQTFDDSTHSRMSQKHGGFGANGAAASATASSVGGPAGSAPPPAYITAADETVGNPIPLGAAAAVSGGGLARGKDASGDVGLLSRGRDAGSFKPNHNLPAFEGIFASRSGGGDGAGSPGGAGQKTAATAAHPAAVELAKYSNPEMMRKDSMATAAAAASAASRSQGAAGSATVGDADMNPRDDGFSSVLSSGVVEEGNFSQQQQQQQQQQRQRPAPRAHQPAAGGGGDDAGITWTAGQNLNHRRGYDQASESYGGDSAAGSVYDLQPPDDDEQHPYQGYDDSVAASSPGAYSMYSHYTAGGGAYAGGGTGSELWSSDDGASSRVEDRAGAGAGAGSSRGYRGGGGNGAGVAGGRGHAGVPTIPSPAGLVARADWNSKRNMGAEGGGEGARRGDPQRR